MYVQPYCHGVLIGTPKGKQKIVLKINYHSELKDKSVDIPTMLIIVLAS